MKKKFLLLMSIFVFSCLQGIQDEEPIIVCLETESRLMNIYIDLSGDDNSFSDPNYGQKLKQVLDFDFNHNGYTEVIKKTKALEAIIGSSFELFGKPNEWLAQNIYYVIKLRLKNKQLDARLFLVNSDIVRSFEGLEMTGDLNTDRRKVHLLADTIHKALFNKEGIARTKFLYSVKEKGQGGEYISTIWEADYDGYNARQITKDAGYSISPVYVPPKKGGAPGSFCYVSYKTGQSKIYIASLKDGIGQRLNDFKGNQLMPTITKTCDKIAFISDYTANPDLFLQPFSKDLGVLEKPRQIFAIKHGTQGSPSFNPDGSKIAFVSNKDGSPKVYVMKVPEPNTPLKEIKIELISKQNRESSAPAWSPDGSKIAYCSMIKGFRQIFIYDFDKREEIQVTDGKENKENPTFASNSLHLLFNSTGKNGAEIYLMNLNQPKVVKISQGRGEKHFPNFQP